MLVYVSTKLYSLFQLLPTVHSVHSFEETAEAYNEVKKGHLRGKVVINMEK